MMGIVTACSRESPLGFRAKPQIGGAAATAAQAYDRIEATGARPKMMAMPRRRIHVEYAVIAALMSTASSVVSGAQSPVTTWLRSELAHSAANEPMHQVTAYSATDSSKPAPTSNLIAAPAAWQKSAADVTFVTAHYGQGRSVSSEHGTVLTALIRPAPLGEMTPDPPPAVPPPTAKPLVPSVAAPPPRTEQPLTPPRQEERPAPPPQAPAPEPQAPEPPPQAPAPPQATRTTTAGGASCPGSAAGPCPARTVKHEL